MAPPRKIRDDSKPLSRRILANIKCNVVQTTPRVIWANELPILELIWGEGNVVEVDPKTLDDGYKAKQSNELMPHNKKQDLIHRPSETQSIGFVFTGDARSEYDRLCNVYGRDKDVPMPVCEVVYGRFQDGKFEQLLGLADFPDMPDAQLRSIIMEHGYVPPLGMQPTAEERKEASAAVKRLNEMTREQLLKQVEEMVAETV